MATEKQKLGYFGEKLVSNLCACPKCKRHSTLKLLPPNFKCADMICDFCGYLCQVKTKNVKSTDVIPKQILGAAWAPQKERMDAAIYFPLFLILVNENNNKDIAVYYLSADLQDADIFKVRKKLSEKAKRAGWQGYYYDLSEAQNRMVRLF